MLFSDDMKELVMLLQRHHVRFAVCGGFAVAHHGFLRATMDFDLLIVPDSDNARAVMAALRDFGFGDAGIGESAFLNPNTAITLGAQPNQIDLLTSMSSQSSDEIVANAEAGEIDGLKLRVVSFDDLLRAKRESGRPKDIIDADELERIRTKR